MILRRVSDLTTDAARIDIDSGAEKFSGDLDLWQYVDPCALVSAGEARWLVHVDAASRRVRRLSLDWFWSGDYDFGYQDPIGCLTLPNAGHVVVSVRRSSRLVVLSIDENRQIGEIELAQRGGGSPKLRLLDDEHIVTVDYDTVCLVDLRTMRTVRTKRLQEEIDGVRCFVGSVGIDRDGLVVARPYSGDVLPLDRTDFSTIGRASTARQPLEAVQLAGATVLARDWKTGGVLRGSFADVAANCDDVLT